MKVYILVILSLVLYSESLKRCNSEYNGKYYNCSNANIIDSNLKVGRLTNRNNKCDRCNPEAKYALEYMDKNRKLDICVPTEFQEDVSFKKDVEICGDLTVKGEIINGCNDTVCTTSQVSLYCYQDNCTNTIWCVDDCAIQRINTTCFRDPCSGEEWCVCEECCKVMRVNSTCFRDTCTNTEWCDCRVTQISSNPDCFKDTCTNAEWCIPLPTVCALELIADSDCAIDNCTGVVICNCSGCVEEQLYFVENTNCGGTSCNVSCSAGDVPVGILCNATQGIFGVKGVSSIYSSGSTVFCNTTSSSTVISVGTSCWKNGAYMNQNLKKRFLYKVDNQCLFSSTCSASCSVGDTPISIECIGQGQLRINELLSSSGTCFHSPQTNINISVVCMKQPYAKDCSSSFGSPRRVDNTCFKNTCSVSCNSGEYITPSRCMLDGGSITTDVNDITYTCGSVSTTSVSISALCWPNNGTIAQRVSCPDCQ